MIGDYTYFDDRRYGPDKFEENNVLYNYDFSKNRLVIGKFCAIAAETRFIMTGDHKLDAFSTFPTSFSPAIAIGWRICVDHWGKGYATEGAKAALEYGFSKLQLKEIVATCAVENAGSRKVMEKIGMKYDPENDFTLPNVPIENKMSKCVLYRITKKEWENRANNPSPFCRIQYCKNP